MKEIFMSWLLGIAFGALGVSLYYDGFVADEYKKKLNKASEALIRADKEIKMRDDDIQILIQYMDQIRESNKRLEKKI